MKRITRIKVICLIILISLLLSACQATPQNSVVINKNDGKLEKIISSQAVDSEQTIIPDKTDNKNNESGDKSETGVLSEKWSQTYNLQGLDCSINADIILPKKTEFPVYKIKQREFDDQTIQKVMEYFIKDATGMRKTSPTKEELEEQLILAKEGAYIEDDNGARWEPYKGQQEDIAKLEEQIKNSKEEVFSPVTDDIVLPKDDTYAMPDGGRVYVEASSDSIYIYPLRYGAMLRESAMIDGDAYPGELEGTTLKNVKISQQEAYDKVNSFLKQTGIENMGIAEAEKACLTADITYQTLSEGWYITLSRNDGGSVPTSFFNQPSGILYQSDTDYTKRWHPEVINIYVDETGIKEFSWKYPVEVTEVLNKNVLVLNFDEIKQKILEYIKIGFSYHKEKNANLPDQSIEISKIVLTNVMIPIKNVTDYQMLAPAWMIYYTQKEGDDTKSTFIAINAIDGSNIDLKVHQPKQ